MPTTYTTFNTWAGLLDAISAGYRLYYHAPMDYRPTLISAIVRKDGKLRIYPLSSGQPFTADVGHLDRFRRVVSA